MKKIRFRDFDKLLFFTPILIFLIGILSIYSASFKAHQSLDDTLAMRQVLWMGVATDHPLRYRQRLADAKLVPVALDLSTPEDIEARIDRKAPTERLQAKAVRLCHQAHQQGALLSNCDLAELLGTTDQNVALALTTYERKTKKLVPRRATLHDVGTGLTDKRIICIERYAEGKSSDLVAQETYHSLEAVDRYLG